MCVCSFVDSRSIEAANQLIISLRQKQGKGWHRTAARRRRYGQYATSRLEMRLHLRPKFLPALQRRLNFKSNLFNSDIQQSDRRFWNGEESCYITFCRFWFRQASFVFINMSSVLWIYVFWAGYVPLALFILSFICWPSVLRAAFVIAVSEICNCFYYFFL